MNASDKWAAIEAFAARFYGNRRLTITPYQYPINIAALATGGVSTQTLNIAANADFILIGVRQAFIDGAGIYNTLAGTLLLIDGATGQQYTQAPVQLDCYASNPHVTRDLPYPRIIAGRSSLTAQFTNASGNTVTGQIVLDGVQVQAYD